MKCKKYSTYIFDWSGTISDDRKPVYETTMRLLEHFGKPRITYEDFFMKTEVSPREFFKKFGISVDSEKLFSAYTNMFNIILEEGIKPIAYDRASLTLASLRNMNKTLAVVSAHPFKNLRQEAKKYNLRPYFSLILGSIGEKTKAIQTVCKKFHMSPSSEVVYIGDGPYDIIAARKAGVSAIGITTGYHSFAKLKAEKPDYIIDRLSDLLE